MNERIRLLAEQATERYLDWGGENERTEFNKEKFAELIVRECAEMVDTDGDAVMALRMMEHFGLDK